MDMDWTQARFWFEVLKTSALVAVTIYVWWTTRTRASNAAITAVDKRVDQIEHQLKRRPGFNDLDKMRDEMHVISRGMSEISAQMQSTNALINRLHDYLLNERGKS